ncbi:MAG: type II secretion system protein [Phycisphaerae bacterium]|nr:type II secretion system protein [Phycisphaerae bacterium]
MKNTLRTMNNEQRTCRAFTLIELVVSVALLGIIFLFAGIIFKVSINSYRTAIANTEIMQKLRAITNQLDADFEGMLWKPSGKVNFVKDTNDVRFDSIIFFAIGDFQTTGQYGSPDKKTVVGNAACIFYGIANTSAEPKEKILVRRQTIITADSGVNSFDLVSPVNEYSNTTFLAELTAEKFDANNIMGEPLNPEDSDDFDRLLVMYMARGVDDFTIQYVGGEDWESTTPISKNFNEWRPEDSEIAVWPKYLSPEALKFTFTLYDSKGIIKNGRKFTHIVYLRK